VSDIDDKSYLLGVNLERERILASLEANLERLVSDSFEWNGVAGDEYREFDPDRFKGRLLAFIKGEQPVSANPDNDAASENPDKGEQS
jgi:hypothetical protein